MKCHRTAITLLYLDSLFTFRLEIDPGHGRRIAVVPMSSGIHPPSSGVHAASVAVQIADFHPRLSVRFRHLSWILRSFHVPGRYTLSQCWINKLISRLV